MSDKKFKITWKQVGQDRWEEFHDGYSVGIVTHLPHYARPVSEARQAEKKQARKAKESEDQERGYEKRSKAKDFDEIRQKMIERAGDDEDLLQKLSTSHEAFNKAHDAIRLEALEERHKARLAEIRERQHSTRGRERGDADMDVMAAHESFHAERQRIEAGEYETSEPEE